MVAAGRPKGARRGKSGLHRAGCRITSGGGDSKASATEINRLTAVSNIEGMSQCYLQQSGKGGKAE